MDRERLPARVDAGADVPAYLKTRHRYRFLGAIVEVDVINTTALDAESRGLSGAAGWSVVDLGSGQGIDPLPHW